MLQEVFNWAADRPEWWQDGIRRIITQENITSSDIQDLVRLCKGENGIGEVELEPEILDVSGASLEKNNKSIEILSLSEVENINALKAGQSLCLDTGGLTVIYGQNASGKSGYARILKYMCRSRGQEEPLLPNIYENKDVDQQVKIKYEQDGLVEEFVWTGEDGDIPPELQKVSIFDSKTAVPYIEDENDIAYQPQPLLVLTELAEICSQVKKKLKEDLKEVEKEKVDFSEYDFHKGTDVEDLLNSLSHNTSKDLVKKLSGLDKKEEKEFKELKDKISAAEDNDSKKRIKELKRKSKAFRYISAEILAFDTVLSKEGLESIKEVYEELSEAKKIAKLASEKLFKKQPLDGVGSEEWKKLWGYAKEYSEKHAYPDKDFPHINEDSRCVLCHQHLSEEARDRFADFDGFVQSKAEERVKELEENFKNKLEPIKSLSATKWLESDDLERLKDHSQEEFENVKNTLIQFKERKIDIIESIKEGDWDEISEIPQYKLTLPGMSSMLKKKADKIKDAQDEKELKKIRNKKNELEDKEKLGSILGVVISEIKRLNKKKALEESVESTNPHSITIKSKQLSQNISPDLKENFESELDSLGVNTLDIELKNTRGSSGDVYHQVKLPTGSDSEEFLPYVASEGEQRCIALSNFLTELSTAEHHSAIIFDDPVSSLDHRWRKGVSDRLAEEALQRQVVVFTHDLVFLLRLKEASVHFGADIKFQHVTRTPGIKTGIIKKGLPTKAARPKKRLGQLKNEVQNDLNEVRKEAEEEEVYNREARHYIARLRSICERTIEISLLGGVVERLDSAVHTRKLSNSINVKDEDIQFIEGFMTNCSDLIEGHDSAPAVSRSMPVPSSIMDMAKELDDKRKEWESRKQNN